MAKNIVVIGGGPGGYVAAIKAAQMGGQVTLIEKGVLGGTCVNRGCIPTKALLQSTEILEKIKEAKIYGILAEKVTADYSLIVERKKAAIEKAIKGIQYLMRKNKITVINGVGKLIDARTVGVEGGQPIIADNIIIATGSKPASLPESMTKNAHVISSDEVLTMKEIPASIVIVGGGVIGIEFAQVLHRLGSKVTIVEMLPQILPSEDIEIATALLSKLKKDGIEIFVGAAVKDIKSTGPGKEEVSFTTSDGNEQKRTAEKVLVAVGRRPCTDGLGLEQVKIAMEKGRISVNDRLETSIKGIYAIGDVIGGIMLAHVAMDEGKCAVENIFGANRKMDYKAVPRCVYCSPEVAAVGLTEAQAKQACIEVKVGHFPFSANTKAFIQNEVTGMVKIVASVSHGEVLGVHIIGPLATDLIAEATLALKLEATAEDIANTIHAHPTVSEAMAEAALDVSKMSIHI